MSAFPLPPKEDVAKEIGRVASTLTDDMQAAGIRKARELGFDLARGRISLDETLINLSSVRDLLLDASEKGTLVHLPLKLQYTLYSQTLKVAETLTALVNGTDAIHALEDVVDELTSSIWQYNLHNLSDQVLGFQQKMNQLKELEGQIRKVHREAQEFESSSGRARQLLVDIEQILANAKERGDAMISAADHMTATLGKITEAEQKIAGLAIQAEQHDSAATRHEENAKSASAASQIIAEKLPQIQTEIETAKNTLGELDTQARTALSTFEHTSTTFLADLKNQVDQLRTSTETEGSQISDRINQQSQELNTSASILLKETTSQLDILRTEQEQQLNLHRDTISKEARTTIDAVNTEFRTALAENNAQFETQRSNAQTEHLALVLELNKLEDQIKDSLRRATGFTLFHSFQTRQEALVVAKNFWIKALAGVVTVSLTLSIAFIIYVNFVQSFGPAFYLKLSISLPLIYAIWFCSVQYSRERRLEEEYAFKSSISLSLDPYRELVEKLVAKEKPDELAKYTAFIIESVGRVFTSPMETAFDNPPDSTPTEGIIKAAGDMATDIIKTVKKL